MIDGMPVSTHNGRMTYLRVHAYTVARFTSAAMALLSLTVGLPIDASAEGARTAQSGATIYWCPNRPADQQISARPESGCAPLAQPPKVREGARGTAKQQAPITMDQLQPAAAQFLQRYNHFLDCCADDVAELDQVRELEGEASHILSSIQSSGIYNAGTVVRQYTLGEMVRQIAQSRHELTLIEGRLERISKGMDQLEGQDAELAARTARELDAEREAITKDFRPRRAAPAARAGVQIQETTIPNWAGESPTGSSSLQSTTGADIGDQSTLAPRPGDAARDTSLSDRVGTAADSTTLRSSTGFAIEEHQHADGRSSTRTRVGADVGDSSLNR